MTQGGRSGGDFHLPDEILAVIPTDPYEQLDLARKITSLAIASRVSKLESEASWLRRQLSEKDKVTGDLQDKLSRLEHMFKETDDRLRVALEENIKLSSQRDSLALMSKKLARDLAKLEAFKRHLMQSLNDDNHSHAETVDIETCDHSIVASSWKEDENSISHASSNQVGGNSEMDNTNQDAPRPAGQKFSFSPWLTPNATPKVTSTGGSPIGQSTAGSPKKASGATSPTKLRVEGLNKVSPWFSSSQQSSVANSPPRGRSLPGRTPRIDGKEFFRQARSRLSYEQFRSFLGNVKELNDHKQSREETLRKAEEIFGTDNKDLFLSFHGLLNRSLP